MVRTTIGTEQSEKSIQFDTAAYPAAPTCMSRSVLEPFLSLVGGSGVGRGIDVSMINTGTVSLARDSNIPTARLTSINLCCNVQAMHCMHMRSHASTSNGVLDGSVTTM